MYKKKFDKRYLLIVVIVLFALGLVILSISLKKDRNLNPVEKIVKDAGCFVVKVVSMPVNFVKDKMNGRKVEKKDLKNSSSYDNMKDEVKKLKELLNLNTVLSNQILLNATVIHRNIGYFYDEVTIDKGKADGIEKDMAVVNYKGLVGKTSKVSNHTCSVKLLSNDNMNNKISVKVKTNEDYVYGLIYKYDSKSNTYMVEGISQNANIPADADVVTTGMGNVFPSGLLIGKVKGTTTDNFDLSKVLEVKSAVDFNDIDYIAVVKRSK